MIPTGYIRVLSRALIYQHCRGHEPDLLIAHDRPDAYAVWCPVCEHLVTGTAPHQTVADWNDHCIARFSTGTGR
jgi:hypothetical protein